MPNPLELQFDPITVNWTYIRYGSPAGLVSGTSS
jgi:hypothetical protein